MKKICIIVCLIFISIFSLFSACSQEEVLEEKVTMLRSEVYYGQCEDFSIQAFYGFEKKNLNAKNSFETVYALTFRIKGENYSNDNCSLSFTFNEKEYSNTFKLDPVSNILTTKIIISDFKLKNFVVSVLKDSDKKEVELVSQTSSNAISYQKALAILNKKQANLIKAYLDDDGIFSAQIHMRILVKNQKTYWYIGIVKNSSTKALLLDAVSGDTLAIRDVF